MTPDYKLEDWTRDNYAETDVLETLKSGCNDTVPRVNINELTPEDFVERFVKPNRPVIVRGVADGWPMAREFAWKVGFS